MREGPMRRFRTLVLRFRSSHPFAARSRANFGIIRSTSNSIILVRFSKLKFLYEQSGKCCRKFKFTALGSICILIGALVLAAVAAAAPAQAQVGYDRPGGDYANAPVRSGDPAICAARCERDGRCHAWSFSYPLTAAPAAMCWLKNKVTPRIEAECCVSGVRGAGVVEPPIGATEFGIDRVGGDYRNFELPPDHTGGACRAACQGEGKCRAWTYQRPGYTGPAARCFLKDRIKPPRRKPCCISGVVR